jgi:SNF2 family DNA or RNA helicase
LPEKVEITIGCPMSFAQQKLYTQVQQRNVADVAIV